MRPTAFSGRNITLGNVTTSCGPMSFAPVNTTSPISSDFANTLNVPAAIALTPSVELGDELVEHGLQRGERAGAHASGGAAEKAHGTEGRRPAPVRVDAHAA